MSDGTSIPVLTESMRKHGWDLSKPLPDMVRRPDSGFMTIDHRRIIAANQADLPFVPARVHGYNEPLSASFTQTPRYHYFKAPVDFTDLTSNRTM